MVKKTKKIVRPVKVKKILVHGIEEFPNIIAVRDFLKSVDVSSIRNVQAIGNKYVVWHTHMIEQPVAVPKKAGIGNIR